VGISVKQPRTMKERLEVCQHCCGALEITMPIVVDEMDDRVGHAYSGMPDRLYVIDRAGKVAYKAGRGPFGFKPAEMEQALVMTLLDEATPPKAQARVPLLSDEAAWKRLPLTGKDVGKPLPTWARALARPLPATTAAMLRLDYLHRAGSPLGPALAGKLRWVAARANRCAYAEAVALADLRRAGLKEDELKALTAGPAHWPASERDALAFADQLTRNASRVTDEQVAGLIKRYGDKQVVAMVLLLAYANFQDRLLLTLGIPAETGAAPLDVQPASKRDAGAAVPPRRPPEKTTTALPELLDDPAWKAFDFAALQRNLDHQRERPGRIRVPSWEEVRRQFPSSKAPRRPLGIRWSLVCMGYQPELASAWSACTANFAQEAKPDRVFEESLFWVVTRSLECFY
jgi:alkylhydroperoxidase family enzyme